MATAGCVIPLPVGDASETGTESSDGDPPADEPTLGASSSMLTTGETTSVDSGSTAASESETGVDPQGDTGVMTDCFDLPDEASCEQAGCGSTTVVEITESCECISDTHVCFESPVGFGFFDYMWHEQTGMVAYFGPRWPQVPYGWHLCTEPGAPPACGCNAPGNPPQCP